MGLTDFYLNRLVLKTLDKYFIINPRDIEFSGGHDDWVKRDITLYNVLIIPEMFQSGNVRLRLGSIGSISIQCSNWREFSSSKINVDIQDLNLVFDMDGLINAYDKNQVEKHEKYKEMFLKGWESIFLKSIQQKLKYISDTMMNMDIRLNKLSIRLEDGSDTSTIMSIGVYIKEVCSNSMDGDEGCKFLTITEVTAYIDPYAVRMDAENLLQSLKASITEDSTIFFKIPIFELILKLDPELNNGKWIELTCSSIETLDISLSNEQFKVLVHMRMKSNLTLDFTNDQELSDRESSQYIEKYRGYVKEVLSGMEILEKESWVAEFEAEHSLDYILKLRNQSLTEFKDFSFPTEIQVVSITCPVYDVDISMFSNTRLFLDLCFTKSIITLAKFGDGISRIEFATKIFKLFHTLHDGTSKIIMNSGEQTSEEESTFVFDILANFSIFSMSSSFFEVKVSIEFLECMLSYFDIDDEWKNRFKELELGSNSAYSLFWKDRMILLGEVEIDQLFLLFSDIQSLECNLSEIRFIPSSTHDETSESSSLIVSGILIKCFGVDCLSTRDSLQAVTMRSPEGTKTTWTYNSGLVINIPLFQLIYLQKQWCKLKDTLTEFRWIFYTEEPSLLTKTFVYNMNDIRIVLYDFEDAISARFSRINLKLQYREKSYSSLYLNNFEGSVGSIYLEYCKFDKRLSLATEFLSLVVGSATDATSTREEGLDKSFLHLGLSAKDVKELEFIVGILDFKFYKSNAQFQTALKLCSTLIQGNGQFQMKARYFPVSFIKLAISQLSFQFGSLRWKWKSLLSIYSLEDGAREITYSIEEMYLYTETDYGITHIAENSYSETPVSVLKMDMNEAFLNGNCDRLFLGNIQFSNDEIKVFFKLDAVDISTEEYHLLIIVDLYTELVTVLASVYAVILWVVEPFIDEKSLVIHKSSKQIYVTGHQFGISMRVSNELIECYIRTKVIVASNNASKVQLLFSGLKSEVTDKASGVNSTLFEDTQLLRIYDLDYRSTIYSIQHIKFVLPYSCTSELLNMMLRIAYNGNKRVYCPSTGSILVNSLDIKYQEHHYEYDLDVIFNVFFVIDEDVFILDSHFELNGQQAQNLIWKNTELNYVYDDDFVSSLFKIPEISCKVHHVFLPEHDIDHVYVKVNVSHSEFRASQYILSVGSQLLAQLVDMVRQFFKLDSAIQNVWDFHIEAQSFNLSIFEFLNFNNTFDNDALMKLVGYNANVYVQNLGVKPTVSLNLNLNIKTYNETLRVYESFIDPFNASFWADHEYELTVDIQDPIYMNLANSTLEAISRILIQEKGKIRETRRKSPRLTIFRNFTNLCVWILNLEDRSFLCSCAPYSTSSGLDIVYSKGLLLKFDGGWNEIELQVTNMPMSKVFNVLTTGVSLKQMIHPLITIEFTEISRVITLKSSIKIFNYTGLGLSLEGMNCALLENGKSHYIPLGAMSYGRYFTIQPINPLWGRSTQSYEIGALLDLDLDSQAICECKDASSETSLKFALRRFNSDINTKEAVIGIYSALEVLNATGMILRFRIQGLSNSQQVDIFPGNTVYLNEMDPIECMFLSIHSPNSGKWLNNIRVDELCMKKCTAEVYLGLNCSLLIRPDVSCKSKIVIFNELLVYNMFPEVKVSVSYSKHSISLNDICSKVQDINIEKMTYDDYTELVKELNCYISLVEYVDKIVPLILSNSSGLRFRLDEYSKWSKPVNIMNLKNVKHLEIDSENDEHIYCMDLKYDTIEMDQVYTHRIELWPGSRLFNASEYVIQIQQVGQDDFQVLLTINPDEYNRVFEWNANQNRRLRLRVLMDEEDFSEWSKSFSLDSVAATNVKVASKLSDSILVFNVQIGVSKTGVNVTFDTISQGILCFYIENNSVIDTFRILQSGSNSWVNVYPNETIEILLYDAESKRVQFETLGDNSVFIDLDCFKPEKLVVDGIVYEIKRMHNKCSIECISVIGYDIITIIQKRFDILTNVSYEGLVDIPQGSDTYILLEVLGLQLNNVKDSQVQIEFELDNEVYSTRYFTCRSETYLALRNNVITIPYRQNQAFVSIQVKKKNWIFGNSSIGRNCIVIDDRTPHGRSYCFTLYLDDEEGRLRMRYTIVQFPDAKILKDYKDTQKQIEVTKQVLERIKELPALHESPEFLETGSGVNDTRFYHISIKNMVLLDELSILDSIRCRITIVTRGFTGVYYRILKLKDGVLSDIERPIVLELAIMDIIKGSIKYEFFYCTSTASNQIAVSWIGNFAMPLSECINISSMLLKELAYGTVCLEIQERNTILPIGKLNATWSLLGLSFFNNSLSEIGFLSFNSNSLKLEVSETDDFVMNFSCSKIQMDNQDATCTYPVVISKHGSGSSPNLGLHITGNNTSSVTVFRSLCIEFGPIDAIVDYDFYHNMNNWIEFISQSTSVYLLYKRILPESQTKKMISKLCVGKLELYIAALKRNTIGSSHIDVMIQVPEFKTNDCYCTLFETIRKLGYIYSVELNRRYRFWDIEESLLTNLHDHLLVNTSKVTFKSTTCIEKKRPVSVLNIMKPRQRCLIPQNALLDYSYVTEFNPSVCSAMQMIQGLDIRQIPSELFINLLHVVNSWFIFTTERIVFFLQGQIGYCKHIEYSHIIQVCYGNDGSIIVIGYDKQRSDIGILGFINSAFVRAEHKETLENMISESRHKRVKFVASKVDYWFGWIVSRNRSMCWIKELELDYDNPEEKFVFRRDFSHSIFVFSDIRMYMIQEHEGSLQCSWIPYHIFYGSEDAMFHMALDQNVIYLQNTRELEVLVTCNSLVEAGELYKNIQDTVIRMKPKLIKAYYGKGSGTWTQYSPSQYRKVAYQPNEGKLKYGLFDTSTGQVFSKIS